MLGFAPLIKMDSTVEFKGLDVDKWSLMHLTKKLCNRKVRCYIGNHDTRVGTKNTYEFISQLATNADNQNIRSSPIELIIGPSIGHKGHGTLPEVFKSGADWMREQLL
jgi:esterase FrsA